MLSKSTSIVKAKTPLYICNMEQHTKESSDYKTISVTQSIEFQDSVVQVLKNNMILVKFKRNCIVGANHFKVVMQAAHQMLNRQKYKVIVCTEPGVTFTKEGLEYSNSNEHMKYKIAWASVTDNSTKIFFTNLFQSIRSSDVPFKMFKCVDDAMLWLENT